MSRLASTPMVTGSLIDHHIVNGKLNLGQIVFELRLRFAAVNCRDGRNPPPKYTTPPTPAASASLGGWPGFTAQVH
jgi:hypothetical protein